MKSNVVTINDPNYEKPITFYLDPKLKKNFDEKILPNLHKRDKDAVIAIDGLEGSGKSTLAFQIAKYIDHSFNINRIVFDPEGFRDAIFKATKGQAIVFDEAFTGFSSRASLSAVNRALVSLMMQMRQKNLIVIIVLPTFFLLDKYVALFRTKFLIHVYENKGVRGYFRIYNRKKKKYLYLMGKQTYSYGRNGKHYVRTSFKGRFYGVFAVGDDKAELDYRDKKAKALEATEKNPMTSGQVKYREQRDLLLYLLKETTKMTYQQLDNFLQDYEFSLSFQQIAKICSKFKGTDIRLEEKEELDIVEDVPEGKSEEESRSEDKSEEK